MPDDHDVDPDGPAAPITPASHWLRRPRRLLIVLLALASPWIGLRSYDWYQRRPLTTLQMPPRFDYVKTIHEGGIINFFGVQRTTTRIWRSPYPLEQTCALLATWLEPRGHVDGTGGVDPNTQGGSCGFGLRRRGAPVGVGAGLVPPNAPTTIKPQPGDPVWVYAHMYA